MLFQMAIAVLLSEEIYNFSELLEQPLLVSLKTSSYAWMYELIEIFNSGDIARFNSAVLHHVLFGLFRMSSKTTGLSWNKKSD